MPLMRFDCDAAVGCDQRKLAVERFVGCEQHMQGRALPRRDRSRQDRDLVRVLARASLAFGPCADADENQDEKRA